MLYHFLQQRYFKSVLTYILRKHNKLFNFNRLFHDGKLENNLDQYIIVVLMLF
uniref:Uncharacterized protein n=1 Tax=Echinococcus granulosus TaxID=6210 RepID=A0A068WAZ2_ECHGR|nr:hypothetical protein EgrG_000798400 [Echinococcus granulosus]